MRPVHLKISAFGPYAGYTEIPLGELGTQGLYLITGDTGAGKTTIFDAICYALFGEASGPARNDTSMFRSKYADPDTPTVVELLFTHAGEEYTVKRNPEYMRPAKKGKGLTRQLAEAELHMPDGRIITKIRPVNDAIEGLLGINRDQFSQISMLAQGDFLKLLLADTKTRIEVFRELFKTENYLALQKKLDGSEKDLNGRVKDERKSIAQYISGIQADKDDVLMTEVERAQKDEMTAEDVVALLDALTGKDEALKDSIDEELENAGRELESVNAAIGAAQVIEKARNSLKEARERLAVEEPKKEGLGAALREAEDALKDKPSYEKQATLIESELQSYDKALALDKDISDTGKKRSDLEAEIERDKKKEQALISELAGYREELEGIKDTAADLAKCDARISGIRAEAAETGEVQETLDSLDKDRAKLTAAQESYREADAVFRRLNLEYENLEQAFLDGQAGILAGGLKDGQKCPVCGSLSHPSPACISQDVPTERELEVAKKSAESARVKREAAATEAGGLDKTVQNKEEELRKKLLKLFNDDSLDRAYESLKKASLDCRKRLKEEEEKAKKLRDDAGRKDELDALIPKKEKELEEIRAGIGRIGILTAQIVSDLEAKTSLLLDLKKSLRFEDKKSAQDEMKKLQKKAEDLQSAYNLAKKSYEEHLSTINDLKAVIKSNEKTVSSAGEVDLTAKKERQAELNAIRKECMGRRETVAGRIASNERIRHSIIMKSDSLSQLEKKLQWVRTLSYTANGQLSGKEKIMLETYIQTAYFDRIIQRANLRLMTMSAGQYELVRLKEAGNTKSQSGLDLGVTDHYNGTERSVRTLSGGESFMAALSLALGLSDEVQSSAGGIQIDTLFVDEGFGSLDMNSLDQAYRALAGLAEGNRLVGIISHVEDLKERIDRQVIVTKEKSGGSSIRIKV